MKSSYKARYLLATAMSAAMLSGCGGTRENVGPSLLPHTVTATGPMANTRSWMLPQAKGTYLYVADNGTGIVYVYNRFPKTNQRTVREIRDLDPYGLCSDKDGNVFVTGRSASGSSEILEYAHGGTTPIATLPDSPSTAEPAGCAIDRANENLAVANVLTDGLSSSGDVLVYKGAQGTPTAYTDSDITQPLWCAYDNGGNLYVEGVNTASHVVVYAVLRKGSNELVNLNISGLNQNFFGGIAWDGKYLVVPGYIPPSEESLVLYQVQISGSTGTIVNSIILDGFRIGGGMTIYGGEVLIPDESVIVQYHYPAGGKPIIRKRGRQKLGKFVTDETISVAPSHK